jgi:hypothetical protein
VNTTGGSHQSRAVARQATWVIRRSYLTPPITSSTRKTDGNSRDCNSNRYTRLAEEPDGTAVRSAYWPAPEKNETKPPFREIDLPYPADKCDRFIGDTNDTNRACREIGVIPTSWIMAACVARGHCALQRDGGDKCKAGSSIPGR